MNPTNIQMTKVPVVYSLPSGAVPPSLIKRPATALPSALPPSMPDNPSNDEIHIDDYRVARVRLERVSYESVQHLLYTLYQKYQADPQYMFVAECDREAVAPHNDHGIIRRLGRIFQVMNHTTGKLIYQVALANQEPNTIVVGFFAQ